MKKTNDVPPTRYLRHYADSLRSQKVGEREIFYRLLAEFNGTPYQWAA